MAALQIACHFDLAEAMKAEPGARARIVFKLERMIERERQRGMRNHWSYDLNRHIALKQALDRLRPLDSAAVPSKSSKQEAYERRRRRAAPPRIFTKARPNSSETT